LLAAAMPGRWPQVCRVKIMFESLMIRYHKNEFDEMLCKLDSDKYARAFHSNPTLPSTKNQKPETKVFPSIV